MKSVVVGAGILKLILVVAGGVIVPTAQAAEYEIKLCLHAYYVHDKNLVNRSFSGHSSISIEVDGKKIHSWGYFPKKNLSMDSDLDGKVEKKTIIDYISYYKSKFPLVSKPRFLQTKMCQAIPETAVNTVHELANSYEQKFGAWSVLRNNCVAFSKYIYQSITGDEIILTTPRPKEVYDYIEARLNGKPMPYQLRQTNFEIPVLAP